ncbi:MAG TPA: response regulator transcription factor [Terriglobales bacterium]|nr:response regulator transcription factor [Terriglobales bacterium]
MPVQEPTVFIVEDDKEIAGLIKLNLRSAGMKCRHFFSVDKVIQEALVEPPDLFILDVMLPGINGLDLCRLIRSNQKLARIPVIMASAKISEDDMLAGFDAGADDYMTKPFSPREMVARAQAVLRRYAGLPDPMIQFGHVEIDSAAMVLRVNRLQVPTTAVEFRLLKFLVQSPGLVFTRDRLREAVWGDTSFSSRRSVDVYISKLREKIELDPEKPQYLLTVRGSGYKFVLPRTEIAS